MSENRIGVWATEQQWASCVQLLTYAAVTATKQMDSKDEKEAETARLAAPKLRDCESLIDRIADAAPRIHLK